MALCLQAWIDLASERPISFGGVGPIPRSKVIEWAAWQRLDRAATNVLWTVIRRLERDRTEAENSKAAMQIAARRGK